MKYIEELQKFIDLNEQTCSTPDYFYDIFLDYNQESHGPKHKKIGIIGDTYYSIYAKAYGLKPINLNGGSYFTGENTDVFPQISDPIAKSCIGLLLDEELKLRDQLEAVLIVAVNDSYKKAIAYLRDAGINVIQVEPIPYIRTGKPFALIKQQLSAINDVSKLVFGVFNESTFTKEVKALKRAYEIMEEDTFLALPSITQAFLLHTLHNAWDKNEWCDELEEFLEDKTDEIPPSQITVMGSAIHLPNHKLFQICQDLGITHFDNECVDFPNYGELEFSSKAFQLVKNCFDFQHKNAYSSATIGNVDSIVLPQNTGGIVFYLLKGQVSEAFLADRMEELAIEQGVPYICVETDYTYTDSEQMKIRVEAFYEMIKVNAVRAKTN